MHAREPALGCRVYAKLENLQVTNSFKIRGALNMALQVPDVDVVMTPVSGGGLLGGVSAACKALKPEIHVIGAEPAALPRYGESLAAGRRVTVPKARSIADALVALAPGERCFPVVQANVQAVLPVPDQAIRQAHNLLLAQGKLLAEPSSCIAIAAVLAGLVHFAPDDAVCFVISGGNVKAPEL